MKKKGLRRLKVLSVRLDEIGAFLSVFDIEAFFISDISGDLSIWNSDSLRKIKYIPDAKGVSCMTYDRKKDFLFTYCS